MLFRLTIALCTLYAVHKAELRQNPQAGRDAATALEAPRAILDLCRANPGPCAKIGEEAAAAAFASVVAPLPPVFSRATPRQAPESSTEAQKRTKSEALPVKPPPKPRKIQRPDQAQASRPDAAKL